MLSIAHIRLLPLLLYLSLVFSAEAADYLGKPVQMYSSSGQLTWDAEYDSYAKVRKLRVGSLKECPFRWSGQYWDEETGLCYNRFRMFDPRSGTYISQDPFGFLGGLSSFYGYPPDSNYQIDPLGLLTYNTMPGKTGYQKHHIIPQQLKNHPAVKNAGMSIHNSNNVKYLPTKAGIAPNPNLAVHNGSHPKYTQAVQRDLDKIYRKGKGKGWTQAKYQSEVGEVIKKYSNLLDKGKIKCK